MYVYISVHTCVKTNNIYINIYGKETIQKHAQVLLILQERFKAQSHLVQENFLHVSALQYDFYQAILYDDDTYDNLSPLSDNRYIVIKDVAPHYIRYKVLASFPK